LCLHPPTSPRIDLSIETVERVFYSGMAILLCVCVYIGFSPTYFQAGMLRAPLPSPILHIHGAVFTCPWRITELVQLGVFSGFDTMPGCAMSSSFSFI
jgi:hypothetical protein